MKLLLEGGEPFFFRVGKVGILLVHGFTGSPWEMRWLGEKLAEAGNSVLGVRLFGHATKQEDLTRVRWWDWYHSLLDGYHILRSTCEEIFLLGQSLGGALCMFLGSQIPPTGIITLSAPYFLPDARMSILRPLLPLISKFWRYSPKEPATDWVDQQAMERNLEYDAHPIRGGMEVYDLLLRMQSNLHLIQSPVLMIYSHGDAIITPEHAEKYQASLVSEDKEIFWLEKSGHNIASDAAREQVLFKIQEFIQRSRKERL